MKLLLTVMLLALFPFLASATAITSGTIAVRLTTGAFNFSGPDFSVSGVFADGGWDEVTCRSCQQPGGVMGVNGGVSGYNFTSGNATVGSTSFPFVSWGSTANTPHGSVFFVSGPAITLDAGPGTYHSTFTLGPLFGGSLCGVVSLDPLRGQQPCDVDLPGLTGSGIVDVNISSGGGTLNFTNAVYTFTPEPQTWMLVLTGIAAIVAWRLKVAQGASSLAGPPGPSNGRERNLGEKLSGPCAKTCG